METTVATVAKKYTDALAAKDFGTVAGMFAADIVWHQPGDHQLSGTYSGQAAVGELLGKQMAATQGTFELSLTGDFMINGDTVAFPVQFSGQRDEETMSMAGVDVIRIAGEQVAEVWLFSADQAAENAFWGA
jgi:ketosteroid isomerase-like protein